jgi:phosphatidylinositol alpha-1,6-mannosyltransferase
MNILFISRAYPPVIGGIEKQNFEVSQALSKIARVEIIANRHGKKFLPFFLPYSFFRALFRLHDADIILLGDGVLAILGFLVKLVSNKPVVCILHGLDLTFQHSIYQNLWIKRFIPSLDKWIAVGNETIRQGELRGLTRNKFVFIENGVSPSYITQQPPSPDLPQIVHAAPTGKIMLTLGRLVKRKGVEWFVREVMPLLPNDVTYIVAGDGIERDRIQQAILDKNMQDRVLLIGVVTDSEKQILLNSVDLFIQPNIPVEGDMEGFGLTVLEAAAAGRVVIASSIEGLKDAIKDGFNGFLLPSKDAFAYKEKIESLFQNRCELQKLGCDFSAYTKKHYSWDGIAQRYFAELFVMVSKK